MNKRNLKNYNCRATYIINNPYIEINKYFIIWAEDKNQANRFIKNYYKKLDFDYPDLVNCVITFNWITTLWCRLFNKVPDKPSCKEY